MKYAYVEERGMSGKNWAILAAICLGLAVLVWAIVLASPVTNRDLCDTYKAKLRDKPRIMWTPNETAKMVRYCNAAGAEDRARRAAERQ